MRRAIALSVFAAVLTLWPSIAASAHPLGNFTVNRYSGIHVEPDEIRVEYVIDMAEIPTFQELATIDADGDGLASASELRTWAVDTAPQLLGNLRLSIDGRPQDLSVDRAAAELRPGQGGLHTLRFQGVFAVDAPERGALSFEDRNFADRIGWREVTAVGEDGATLAGSTVPVASVSQELLSYPTDLLSSPLAVTSMTASFAPGTSAPPGHEGAGEGAAAQGSARPGVEAGPFAGLIGNHGLPLVLLGFVLAIGLGAWHALLPGHGKTLMAAYMISGGAKVRQAAAVGSAVAIMHTVSVLGLGLLVLALERTFRPEALYPWLGMASGIAALAVGAHLLHARIGAWRHGRAHDRDERHGHDHGHDHGNDLPPGGPLSRKGILALAFAGGILPAPSALLVMLAAIQTHRVVYGLALVIAFSVGLAGALVIVGVGALRAREAVGRRLSTSVGRLVPVLSAGGIVAVGTYLALRGASGI